MAGFLCSFLVQVDITFLSEVVQLALKTCARCADKRNSKHISEAPSKKCPSFTTRNVDHITGTWKEGYFYAYDARIIWGVVAAQGFSATPASVSFPSYPSTGRPSSRLTQKLVVPSNG